LLAFVLRTLRVARTLADLDGSAAVRRLHIAEALGYRRASAANGNRRITSAFCDLSKLEVIPFGF
jgi:hypothetical protein